MTLRKDEYVSYFISSHLYISLEKGSPAQGRRNIYGAHGMARSEASRDINTVNERHGTDLVNADC